MTTEFSIRTRSGNLEAMAAAPVDALIIGGGIVGAWTALTAAVRGYRVALVEKGDFASGTSGKTSQLIHGGLRYLQKFRIGLVRQAAQERDVLVRMAPRLVKPLRFLIPVYRDRGTPAWQLRIGLFVYDALSREKLLPRRRWLTGEETLRLEPNLERTGLVRGALYFDAVTHDARLVLCIVQAASEAGALVANYALATALLRENGQVRGARVLDLETGVERIVRARAVVNATGVWSPDLQHVEHRLSLRPTKGVHVLVPRDRIGHRGAIVLPAKDRRIVFALPWGDLSLIGTTDTDYAGDREHVEADRADVDYLIETVNTSFPNAHLGTDEVIGTYAGLRPLVNTGAEQESDISRKHEIISSPDGLISAAGGKLTTGRAIAEEILNRIAVRVPRPDRGVDTRTLSLAPSASEEALDSLRRAGADEEVAARLADLSAAEFAVERSTGRPDLLRRILEHIPVSGLEVLYSARGEMVVHLDDFMVRRGRLAYESPDAGLDVAPLITALTGDELGWDDKRRRAEVARYQDLVAVAHRWREGTGHG